MEKKIDGYKYMVTMNGRRGSRPTIVGTSLEPWHILCYDIDYILSSWKYLTREQVEEAFLFYRNNKSYYEELKNNDEIHYGDFVLR